MQKPSSDEGEGWFQWLETLPETEQMRMPIAAPVEAVANDILASGGVAETASVDALKRKWRLTCGS